MCNPHNPTGRVFTKKELQRIADAVNNIPGKTVYFSDEIFADLAFEDFHSALSLGLSCEKVVVASSISKAFNVESIQGGFSIVPGAILLKEYKKWQQALRVSHTETAMLMLEVCYSPSLGPEWLGQVKHQIQHNLRIASEIISKDLPQLIFSKPEAGYFTVLNFKKYFSTPEEMQETLLRAGLFADSMDSCYDIPKYSTFEVRINLAVPPKYLVSMLVNLQQQINGSPKAKL